MRYPSAEDLRSDLRRFLEGHPVTALGAAGVAAAGGVAAGALADATVAVPAAATMAGAGAGVAGAGPATGQVPYAQEPPKKRTGLLIGLLVVLLLIVAGVLFFVGRNLGQSKANVDVPNVVGRQVLEATTELTNAGFKVVPTNEESDKPRGEVLAQDPKEGSKAEEGSTVRLTVSGGVGQAQVPDVVGRTSSAAQTIITDAGFVPEVLEEASDTVPAGQVISQSPAAGTQADKRSVVQIKVSSGIAQVPVPNVVGQSESAASNQLGQAGFQVETTNQTSASVAAGRVISQDPAPGQERPKGSTVNLVISTGPPPTTSSSSTTSSSTTSSTSTTTTKAP
jgi:serine/threonine-protein kinase